MLQRRVFAAGRKAAIFRRSTLVAAAEWKAVIDDWYPDGTIDEPHRCEAIREAIKQLPSRDYFDAYADLHRFERRACA